MTYVLNVILYCSFSMMNAFSRKCENNMDSLIFALNTCGISRLVSNFHSIERIFSNFGLIQTKLRNRLGIEKAGKLVTCYRYLRGNIDIEW